MASGGGFERTRTQTGGGGSGEVGPSGAGDVSVMARDHIRGAVTWLEGLGDSPDYDGAWVDLVQSGFSSDPGVALVGALRLSDEGWREKYTRRYLARWMKSDKEAAQSWVAEYTEYLPPQGHPALCPEAAQSSEDPAADPAADPVAGSVARAGLLDILNSQGKNYGPDSSAAGA